MQFLVYEQDPVVLTDIYETLSDAFDVVIRKLSPAQEVSEMADAVREASVVFASISQRDFDTKWRDLLTAFPDLPVILIGTGSLSGFEPTERRVYLPRPFSSDGLVRAARTVLSGQR